MQRIVQWIRRFFTKSNPRPRAIGAHVHVQLIDKESGKIIIPEIAKGASVGSVYRIYDAGPQCKSGVKKGDQILISAPATAEFDYDGEHYFTLHESRIATVIR